MLRALLIPAFRAAGLPPELKNDLVHKTIGIVRDIPRLPPEFFDIERSVRIIARREGCSIDTVLAQPEKLPFRLAEIFAIQHGASLDQQSSSHTVKPPLTAQTIRSSAQATWEHTGHRPLPADGEIVHGLLAFSGYTWQQVNTAFKHRKITGYTHVTSLKSFLDLEDVGCVTKRQHKDKSILKQQDILDSAHAFLLEHGRRPTVRDKLITHPPLADGVLTWTAINSAIIGRHRGLDTDFSSLSAFLNYHQVPSRLSKNPYRPDIQ